MLPECVFSALTVARRLRKCATLVARRRPLLLPDCPPADVRMPVASSCCLTRRGYGRPPVHGPGSQPMHRSNRRLHEALRLLHLGIPPFLLALWIRSAGVHLPRLALIGSFARHNAGHISHDHGLAVGETQAHTLSVSTGLRLGCVWLVRSVDGQYTCRSLGASG